MQYICVVEEINISVQWDVVMSLNHQGNSKVCLVKNQADAKIAKHCIHSIESGENTEEFPRTLFICG